MEIRLDFVLEVGVGEKREEHRRGEESSGCAGFVGAC